MFVFMFLSVQNINKFSTKKTPLWEHGKHKYAADMTCVMSEYEKI